MSDWRPRIVQHSFGALGSGGPIGALTRVLDSDLSECFEFRHVRQTVAAGGVNLGLARRMANEMRQFKPDLVHVRGLGNEGFHGVLAARIARVPRVLVTLHGSVADLVSGSGSPRQRIVANVLEPATVRMADYVATVTDSALDKPVIRGVKHKVVGVIPNGVDVPVLGREVRNEVRIDLRIPEDAVVLIIVGRLALDKGHLDLLEALDSLSAATTDQVYLLVVGDGPDSERIRDRAAKLRAVQARLLGRRMDVQRLLAASDVFVLPSLHENMSNAILEAMAAGLPVISTRVGGTTEILSQGGGILVPPSDQSSLAVALDESLTDPVLRKRLGADARRLIESKYTTRHMTTSLGELYWRILEASTHDF